MEDHNGVYKWEIEFWWLEYLGLEYHKLFWVPRKNHYKMKVRYSVPTDLLDQNTCLIDINA